MNKEQLTKLVAEKFDAAYASSEHPKKFFITENGRGVTDGGDLYNAVLQDVLGVVKVAMVDILQEACADSSAPAQKVTPAVKPVTPTPRTVEKPTKNAKR